MKIKCPKCKDTAELSDDFSFVKCSHCSLDVTYGEYIKMVIQNDSSYSDILGDYASSGTEGTTSGSLDEWE